VARRADGRFLAAGRADEYSSRRCELARRDVTLAAMRDAGLAALAYYQAIRVYEIVAVQLFTAQVTKT